ncbi:enhanced intracellular survival protein Eis [Leifsonia sp. A12D58]|uniref:GNAT family N-acetyltransferase n=1 Tax=Leifsonia sp. A12D58 TaxID=3397674 RepID=UPI0039E0B5AA
MPHDTRRIDTRDDNLTAASRELRVDAFALDPAIAQTVRTPFGTWGGFDGIDRLVAVADDYEFDSYFGGVRVPTAGIGGVAVAPEHRGNGLASALMKAIITGARERGAVISTLFGAAPALYRHLGYGMLANSYHWRIPTSSLVGIRSPAGYTLLRAEDSDRPEMLELYTQLALAGTGMADHAGIAPQTSTTTRYTLVRDPGGRLAGYCSWHTARAGTGMELRLGEVRALDPLASRALLSGLSRWGSAIEAITVTSVDSEEFWNTVPGVAVPSGIAPYMLRVLDPAAAVAARGWNAAVAGEIRFELRDSIFADNSGAWQLVVSGGAATLTPVTSAASDTVHPPLVFNAEGFALWFAGVATCDELRRTGRLDGGDARAEAILDAMAAQAKPTITHYF